MTFHVFSIFLESIKGYTDSSILKRAQEKKLIKIKLYDIRDFAKDRHRITDDKPYGGGAGMVMKIEPIVKAVGSSLSLKFKAQSSKFVLLSPNGRQFSQKMARDWAKKYKNIFLICGHYEGIDERIKKILKDACFKPEEVSIGPYILTGGEIAAAVIIDAVSRHICGVWGRAESLEENKGSYPVYTRPEKFVFKKKVYGVPKVLLSGNHEKIGEWRKGRSRFKFFK